MNDAPSDSPKDPFAPGTLIAERYRIERRLGEGAVGAVYLAEHIHLGERVAMKVLLPEVSESPEIIARFEREARAAAKIKHPNVVAATDFGQTEDGAFFLVLEYIEGESLRDLLLRGVIDQTRALRILHDIAAGLERAHGFDIVHRDLKPENVMLVKDPLAPGGETVKVLDFGIAKVPTMFNSDANKEVATTQRGLVYGTPEYMSPEQALGEDVDARADLYALGIMAYELFTGTRPFRHESKVALLGMHVTASFPSFADRVPEIRIGDNIERLTRKLMEKRKEERFSDAHTLRMELERLLAHSAGARDDMPLSSRSRRDAAQRRSVLNPKDYPAIDGPLKRPRDGVRTLYDKNIAPIVAPIVAKAKEQAAKDPKRTRIALASAAAGLLLLIILAITLGSSEAKVATLTNRPSPLPATTTTAEEDVSLDLDAPVTDPKKDFEAAVTARNAKRGADVARAWIAKEPSIVSDPEFVSGVRLLSASQRGGEMFPLLETSLGATGVETLYDLAYAEPALPTSTRARQSLDKRDVRSKMPPDVEIALALRKASGCPAKRALLQRAKAGGAARTAKILASLQSTTGCSGFAGAVRDCYPCLRQGTMLQDAISASRSRGSK